MTYKKLLPFLSERGLDIFVFKGKYIIKIKNTSGMDHKNCLNESFNSLQDVFDFLMHPTNFKIKINNKEY